LANSAGGGGGGAEEVRRMPVGGTVKEVYRKVHEIYNVIWRNNWKL
jgi:hypothetical protein